MRQIGRELGVRYVLEGSVRRAGERIRITAQLIDASTGAHRWAEHYDSRLEDIFAVQDEVVRTIVAILAAHVRKAEAERTRTKPPNSWQAHDYYLQAAEAYAAFTTSFNVEKVYETRCLLQKSLAIDPNYARSCALLASSYTVAWANRLDSDYLDPAAFDKAHQLARKAVELDPNLPEAHSVLGFNLVWMGRHDASIAEFERAIALNPNFVDWRFGWPLVLAGQSRRAVDVLQAYMRLDPFRAPLASFFIGVAHFMLEEYAQALAVLRDYVSRVPHVPFGHVFLAVTHAQLGQLEQARTEAEIVVRLNPDYSIGTTRKVVSFKHGNDGELFFDALRKAGLPD